MKPEWLMALQKMKATTSKVEAMKLQIKEQRFFLNKSIKLEKQYNWKEGSTQLKTYMGNHKMKLTSIKKDIERNFEKKNK